MQRPQKELGQGDTGVEKKSLVEDLQERCRWAAGWVGAAGAADLHVHGACGGKPAVRPAEVPGEAKAEDENSLSTGLWGQEGEEGEEEKVRRLGLRQET